MNDRPNNENNRNMGEKNDGGRCPNDPVMKKIWGSKEIGNVD